MTGSHDTLGRLKICIFFNVFNAFGTRAAGFVKMKRFGLVVAAFTAV